MEMRDIEYFAVVARHGHLGRAAEALGMGQPALSMSLRRLEASAQTKLVRRTSKGVELTHVGSALLAHVDRLRLAREDLAREVSDLARGRAGHLRIGASPSNSEALLPEACSALLMEASKVTFDVAVMDNDRLVPAVREGALDLAVTHVLHAPPADIEQRVFREDEFVVYCAASHRLAKRRTIALADLAEERWAISAAGAFGPLLSLRRAFDAHGLPAPRYALVSDLVAFKLRAVAASDLIGVTVRHTLRHSGAQLPLKILPLKDLDWTRPVAVAFRRGAYLPPAARRFIDILVAMAKAAA
jgi:DNA-binding transcriptional LysR family regulator